MVVLAGAMAATSANTGGGSDLRPDRNADLADVVQAQARQNQQLTEQAAQLRGQVDQLSRDRARTEPSSSPSGAAEAGLTAVRGPAVVITLDDAPLSVQPTNIDPDLLVVHQQDIQTVVNALWSGGAEAMTIQGQRVTSLTGIKCVGNTVVLRGIPYAPPYEIAAIGDPSKLQQALASDRGVAIYKEYARTYHLGWKVATATRTMPGYSGSTELSQASAGPG